MNNTTDILDTPAPTTAMQEIVSSIDEKEPIFVTDKRDGLDCQMVRFYPDANMILAWKNMKSDDWGDNSHYEECFGLHVRDVEGGEETLRQVGIWEQLSVEVQQSITQSKAEAEQNRIEAIKRGHETRKNRKREEWTPEQIKEEKIKIELKKAMDEKFPNRGKGRGTTEMRIYREEALKRITREIETA